jgi:hypothetical protein
MPDGELHVRNQAELFEKRVGFRADNGNLTTRWCLWNAKWHAYWSEFWRRINSKNTVFLSNTKHKAHLRCRTVEGKQRVSAWQLHRNPLSSSTINSSCYSIPILQAFLFGLKLESKFVFEDLHNIQPMAELLHDSKFKWFAIDPRFVCTFCVAPPVGYYWQL